MRDTPHEAYLDAQGMRDEARKLPDRLVTLREAMDLVEEEAQAKRSPATVKFYRGHFDRRLGGGKRKSTQ